VLKTFERSSGILLHPTSLPSKYGIGELGGFIFEFIDLLHKSKQKLWQTLPLGPTGYADSPYQPLSSFAGNPMLISLEEFLKEGILNYNEIIIPKKFNDKKVDFGSVIPFKDKIIRKAFEKSDLENDNEYQKFLERESYWLDNYSLYASFKANHEYKPWNEWSHKYRNKEPKALKTWKNQNKHEIDYILFKQYIFHKQWFKVKKYANDKNIKIIGDLPIYVAYDSQDVWESPHYFQLDLNKELLFQAGTPPDYFAKTGQKWGNPLYKWDVFEEENFSWWKKRLKKNFELTDFIRMDHFRGFEAYWRIPAGHATAEFGEWIKAPGLKLLMEIKHEFGYLPIIAEDLGEITEEVEDLRKNAKLPGMKILQFAFSDENNPKNHFLPHNYSSPDYVAYTGTHDNETALGWIKSCNKTTKKHFKKYTKKGLNDVAGNLINLTLSSIAVFSIIPMQDVLRKGKEARMNHPGNTYGNWQWRFTKKEIKTKYFKELAELTELYNR
jgi:4-alpha-glucanotransferase